MLKSFVPVVAAVFAASTLSSTPLAAAEVALTTPAGLSADKPGETVATAKGFVASWSRVRADTGTGSISLRAFSPAGKPLGKELVLQTGNQGYFDPIALSLGGDRAAGFWIRGADGLVGRAANVKTGKLDKEVVVGKVAEALADAAVLSNGAIHTVSYQLDVSNPAAPVKRVAVTALSPAMKVTGAPNPLPGVGANYVATASSDFTIVARKTKGSVALYRNRTDGNIYAVKVTPAGVPAKTAVKVNALPMPLGAFGQNTLFEVEAATLKNGKILVAWTALGSPGEDDAFDIHYRLLTEAGMPAGPERVAHDSLLEEQVYPEIVPLPSGGFVLSWTNNGGPVAGRPRSYVMRRFTAAGLPAGPATTLFSGERALNGEEAQLTAAGPKRVMLIRATGQLPMTLAGIAAAP